jgi:hypothetical protein
MYVLFLFLTIVLARGIFSTMQDQGGEALISGWLDGLLTEGLAFPNGDTEDQREYKITAARGRGPAGVRRGWAGGADASGAVRLRVPGQPALPGPGQHIFPAARRAGRRPVPGPPSHGAFRPAARPAPGAGREGRTQARGQGRLTGALRRFVRVSAAIGPTAGPAGAGRFRQL